MKHIIFYLCILSFVSCKKEDIPEVKNKVTISKITIFNLPEKKSNGQTLELDGTNPDIYIYLGKLSSRIGENLFYTPIAENLPKSSLPYSFTINPTINLMHNDTLLIDMYERDSTNTSDVSHQIIERFTYVINKTDQPKEVEVWGDKNSFNCKVKVALSWY